MMIGTTSRVPGAPGWHYLILDIDGTMSEALFTYTEHVRSSTQKTKSGWHIYTSLKLRLRPMLKAAIQLGADPGWARIARKRGYAFLADKAPVKLPWPVERMTVIQQ